MIEFVVGPNISKEHATNMRAVNATLARLRQQRKGQILVEGPLQKSKLAWKVATYRQAILYRTVMLTEGIALNWNERNGLCSFLAARALIETVAVTFDLARTLERAIKQQDLSSVDTVIMNRTFASRDEEWLKLSPPSKAVNVLTLIERLDQEYLQGVRWHYDSLSERCHPNSLGHHHFFGKLDRDTGATTYRESSDIEGHLNSVLLGAMLIGLAEFCLNDLDKAVGEIAELQDAVDPVGGRS
jgi:hypothetical protein